MNKLRFLSGARWYTAQLPHCAGRDAVFAALSNSQSTPVEEARLFVFDDNCAPCTVEVERGMTIEDILDKGVTMDEAMCRCRLQWKPETDTFFLRNSSDKEFRVLNDEANDRKVAQLLTDWRRLRPACTGILCHTDGGEVVIVDTRTMQSVSFERDSSPPSFPSMAEM